MWMRHFCRSPGAGQEGRRQIDSSRSSRQHDGEPRWMQETARLCCRTFLSDTFVSSIGTRLDVSPSHVKLVKSRFDWRSTGDVRSGNTLCSASCRPASTPGTPSLAPKVSSIDRSCASERSDPVRPRAAPIVPTSGAFPCVACARIHHTISAPSASPLRWPASAMSRRFPQVRSRPRRHSRRQARRRPRSPARRPRPRNHRHFPIAQTS